jgi:hypothetical protein
VDGKVATLGTTTQNSLLLCNYIYIKYRKTFNGEDLMFYVASLSTAADKPVVVD